MASFVPSVRIIPATHCSGAHCPANITLPLIPYNIPQAEVNTTFTSAGPDKITIKTPWNTDLWNKPQDPYTIAHNQPFLYTEVFLREFHSAKVTVSGDWVERYDQGGIVLIHIPEPSEAEDPVGTSTGTADPPKVSSNNTSPSLPNLDWKKWVKSGIEFEFSRPNIGTVATFPWSDWSLLPLTSTQTSATIQLERNIRYLRDGEEVRESGLWLYLLDPVTGEKAGLREITWFFGDDVSKAGVGAPLKEGGKLWVGVYGARPSPEEKEGVVPLEVDFEGFEIRLFDKPREY
ncbi:hypothetical protein DFH27DRAFT_49029 [Peziza echinospora]|nr:hypothetical protein DFH27DRAFT_49029 [Peziza echinospora]